MERDREKGKKRVRFSTMTVVNLPNDVSFSCHCNTNMPQCGNLSS